MATTITYSQELVGDLYILDSYKELMEASTAEGSIYIKTKETLQELFENSNFDDNVKAQMISEVLGNLAVSMTNKAMDTAMAIEMANQRTKYELTKMREDTKLVTAQIVNMAQEEDKTSAEIDTLKWNNYKTQAELYRDWGVSSYLLSPITDTVIPSSSYMNDYGTKVEGLKAARANRYLSYAKSFRQDGLVTLAVDADGKLTSANGTDEGQSYWQNLVTQRQYKGFDDNMRQHVANSSASMMSMLLSTETSGIDYDPYLGQWNKALEYLNTNTPQRGWLMVEVLKIGTFWTGDYITGDTYNIVQTDLQSLASGSSGTVLALNEFTVGQEVTGYVISSLNNGKVIINGQTLDLYIDYDDEDRYFRAYVPTY